MNCDYRDILSRINTDPIWFDENAVPRFDSFTPDACADIYARECALLLIACQACEREFQVCTSWSNMDGIRGHASVAACIADKSIGYGDPPNVDCCPAGPTMSSDTLRVLEYWHHAEHCGPWVREMSLEVDFALDDGEEITAS